MAATCGAHSEIYRHYGVHILLAFAVNTLALPTYPTVIVKQLWMAMPDCTLAALPVVFAVRQTEYIA